jgi:serine/threonine protein kinase
MGVILFHLIYGKYPFEGDCNYEIFQNIITSNYYFPKKNVSPYLVDLLSRIFLVDPSKRIKLYDILNHEWMRISFE